MKEWYGLVEKTHGLVSRMNIIYRIMQIMKM